MYDKKLERAINGAMDEYYKVNGLDAREDWTDENEDAAITYAAEKLNLTRQEIVWCLE